MQITQIHSIMFYGSLCPLEEDFLTLCSTYAVPIVFHRRHMPVAVLIHPSIKGNNEDLLSRQILFRLNEKKKRHIARKLLGAKFESMGWLISPPAIQLKPKMAVKKLRSVEAWHARFYWSRFYKQLGLEGQTRRGKNKDNQTTRILDATSKFVSGIILRWVIFHHLSPYHGFLHEPSEYPSLIYDIFEPYRGDFDKCVFETIGRYSNKGLPEEKVMAACIEEIKEFLDKKVYVTQTRQIVTIHELLHGCVLALRSYLLGTSQQLIIPRPGAPLGGRPVKAGYKLYGRSAGKTDFWAEAKKL